MWLTLSFVIASTWLVCHVEHFENIQSERESMRCTPNSGFFISVNLNQRIFNRGSQIKWAKIVYANTRTNIYPFMDDSTIKTKWKKIYKYMSCECNLDAPIKRTGRYFFYVQFYYLRLSNGLSVLLSGAFLHFSSGRSFQTNMASTQKVNIQVILIYN